MNPLIEKNLVVRPHATKHVSRIHSYLPYVQPLEKWTLPGLPKVDGADININLAIEAVRTPAY